MLQAGKYRLAMCHLSWMDGRTDRWMDGRTDGRTDKRDGMKSVEDKGLKETCAPERRGGGRELRDI